MIENLPDEEILRRSFAAPSYFRLLVEKYQAPFLRKALGILRNQDDAEEIVQESFIKIYKYGDKFKKEENVEFKSWAYKILMNTAFTRYQELKKKIGKEEYLEPLVHNELAGVDGRNDGAISDAKAVVQAVVEKMPDHLARLLKLYYLDDKSYKEICRIENISMTTLKMRLFRAKRLFQKIGGEI